ncbi:MAG TPA: extracellular solute-binding protein [Thermoflexales bacterium]|nr:extracellular solute-binding protein [Thermoflexales bacterium]HQZ23070.1 extracellular solute-binding protein [Thermoflexales bacterium]HQZ99660.1 extracellular solute-binding protein [Thermoflexales bacterium]
MSQEIEFTIQGQSASRIRPLLDEFEAQSGIHVNVRALPWDRSWGDLIKMALYGDGPDVSEIGSTWLGDIATMNALHAFTPDEIAFVGKPHRFLPAAWYGCHLPESDVIQAIPWFVGMQLVYYRRAMLKALGIQEDTAFQTVDHFENTLVALHEAGIKVPWTVPTGYTHATLHNLACWVRGAGGRLVSVDGKRVMFDQPAAREGIRRYFSLGRLLAPSVRHLNALEPDDQFLNDEQTAVTISGPWLINQISANMKNQIGLAMPMGMFFVGGSHLVVWKHSRRREAAIKLIKFLTSIKQQVEYSQIVGELPAVMEAYDLPPYSTERLFKMVIAGLRGTYILPMTRAWGLVEDRLSTEFAGLWAEVLKDPNLNLEEAIARRLEPLARRLELVLGQE